MAPIYDQQLPGIKSDEFQWLFYDRFLVAWAKPPFLVACLQEEYFFKYNIFLSLTLCFPVKWF